ncbi:MAG TPA: NADH-quinone oxidoreductase subunit J, partial [Anaerolineae bacterium]|nr:NADH-quinone oxidoreductase subunit J [Anaerolineae bacterium]
MLLGAERLRGVRSGERWQQVLAGILALALLVVFGAVVVQRGTVTAGTTTLIDTSPTALGLRLFEAYVFPFEVTGILLLAAMIGVVVFSLRKK